MPVIRRLPSARLQLLDGFSLSVDGEALPLQPTIQRLLAFLGLREQPARRSFVAGHLWPEASEHQAAARLRSALWRFGHAEFVETDATTLRLSDDVTVDVRLAAAQAHRLLHDEELRPEDCDVTLLRQDLLPDWWDDWLILERERVRQIRLHALERLATRLIGRGRPAEGITAALDAVAAEPLRESAHRVLVSAYLAEGNYSEAVRHYELFERLLDRELGVAPTAAMRDLIAPRRPPAEVADGTEAADAAREAAPRRSHERDGPPRNTRAPRPQDAPVPVAARA